MKISITVDQIKPKDIHFQTFSNDPAPTSVYYTIKPKQKLCLHVYRFSPHTSLSAPFRMKFCFHE